MSQQPAFIEICITEKLDVRAAFNHIDKELTAADYANLIKGLEEVLGRDLPIYSDRLRAALREDGSLDPQQELDQDFFLRLQLTEMTEEMPEDLLATLDHQPVCRVVYEVSDPGESIRARPEGRLFCLAKVGVLQAAGCEVKIS